MGQRRIYESSSGDTWDLMRDGDAVFVLHRANRASGGVISRIELSTFLRPDHMSAENASLGADDR